MKIMYKGKLRTLEEILNEERDNPEKPTYLKTIVKLLELEKQRNV
jgi:hypothetical protein